MDNVVECKCGALITFKTEEKLTEKELEQFKNRECGVCYLRRMIEQTQLFENKQTA